MAIKPFIKKLYEKVLMTEIWVVGNCDGTKAEQLVSKLAKCKIDLNIDKHTYGMLIPIENESGRKIFVVYVYREDVGIIAHEAGHLVHDIMKDKGIEDDKNAEFRCYYQQYWIYEILDTFKEIKK